MINRIVLLTEKVMVRNQMNIEKKQKVKWYFTAE